MRRETGHSSPRLTSLPCVFPLQSQSLASYPWAVCGNGQPRSNFTRRRNSSSTGLFLAGAFTRSFYFRQFPSQSRQNNGHACLTFLGRAFTFDIKGPSCLLQTFSFTIHFYFYLWTPILHASLSITHNIIYQQHLLNHHKLIFKYCSIAAIPTPLSLAFTQLHASR